MKFQEKTCAMRIKVKLLEAGMSVSSLANVIGRPRSSVSKAINKGIFPKVRREIADFLGLES